MGNGERWGKSNLVYDSPIQSLTASTHNAIKVQIRTVPSSSSLSLGLGTYADRGHHSTAVVDNQSHPIRLTGCETLWKCYLSVNAAG